MASLAERLKRASAPPAVSAPLLVPLDLLRDVLVEHPLVAHLGLAVDETHAALLGLHAWTPAQASTAPARPPARACSHCDQVGTERLDAREGHRVCTACGAVLSGPLNVVREYDAPPRDDVFYDKPTRLQGVSRAVVEATSVPRPRSYRADLEHWNQFTHAGHDTLTDADRTLQTWTEGGHRYEARLAAVLLRPVLQHHYPNPNGLRARLQRGEALPVIHDPEPPARFACPTCDARRHTAKDARFHCRTSFGVKRRRL